MICADSLTKPPKMGIFTLYLDYLAKKHNDPLQLLLPSSKIARSNNLNRLTVKD